MREQCQNCGKTIAKYVILNIVEFLDDDDNKIYTNNEIMKISKKL
jgi:hypothetical protein